ncbi:unnamed protein product [Trichogramma brassicae]|uniref:CCHC-type domain-containing protein n=1 Tax=Trichogramma brassicae TaxID=86971 RepID=A0A6H5I3Y7_9HYME|nr:unnamed protein product [Trichogramma brassicae]
MKIEDLDVKMLLISVPQQISRCSRKISERKNWKSREWENSSYTTVPRASAVLSRAAPVCCCEIASTVGVAYGAWKERVHSRHLLIVGALGGYTRLRYRPRAQLVRSAARATVLADRLQVKLIISSKALVTASNSESLHYLSDSSITPGHLSYIVKFDHHLRTVSAKAAGVIGALTKIMLNSDGPRSSRRKLYAHVYDSILLYGAPIRSTATKKASLHSPCGVSPSTSLPACDRLNKDQVIEQLLAREQEVSKDAKLDELRKALVKILRETGAETEDEEKSEPSDSESTSSDGSTEMANSEDAKLEFVLEGKIKLRQKKSQTNSKQGEFKCYRCNRSNHKASECRFKNAKCNGCGKQGHIQAACRGKPVNYIEEPSEAEDATSGQDSSEDETTTISSVSGSSKHLYYHEDFFAIRAESKKANVTERADPEFLDVELNDKLIAMEIDTGTYYSVISENFKARFFPNRRIESANAILRGYDERVFKISGELRNIMVTLFNETRQLNCYVMSGTGPPLIGRQWLMSLGCWPLSKLLNKMNENKILKMNEGNIQEHITNKFKLLFEPSPGLYNKSKVKIYLRDDAKPIALKARHVPHALKPRVEEEINRLIELGHLERVESSKWATPIVPIRSSAARSAERAAEQTSGDASGPTHKDALLGNARPPPLAPAYINRRAAAVRQIRLRPKRAIHREHTSRLGNDCRRHFWTASPGPGLLGTIHNRSHDSSDDPSEFRSLRRYNELSISIGKVSGKRMPAFRNNRCLIALSILPLMITNSKILKDNNGQPNVIKKQQKHKIFFPIAKPKFHHLLHYGKLLRDFGPCKNCDTSRYESRHRRVKANAVATSSWKDLPYTIAIKQILNMCRLTNSTKNEYKMLDFNTTEICTDDKTDLKWFEVNGNHYRVGETYFINMSLIDEDVILAFLLTLTRADIHGSSVDKQGIYLTKHVRLHACTSWLACATEPP